MQQVRLGRSELVVSRLALGTWQLGGDWGPTDTAVAMDAIRRAADEGVTLFDTAQSYGFGQSEQLLSAALRAIPREQIVIATKGGLRLTDTGLIPDASARSIQASVDASLRALGTSYVDLYQLHWPDPTTSLVETAEALSGLIVDGKIRHVGVSNFDVDQMEALDATLPVETLQPPYDLFRRNIEVDILPYAETHDIGVLVYGTLAHGMLSGSLGPETRFARDDWRSMSPMFQGESYLRNLRVVTGLRALALELGHTLPQLAIAWTLTNPAVHVAIVGTRNREHVDEAIAASAIELSDDVLQRIDDILIDAVPIIGPSPE